jgi:hypothetical protein
MADTPENEYLLLETAKQWRCLADAAGPTMCIGDPKGPKPPARNEVVIAWLLSQTGALIR